jgi:phage recombination protein Bet
MSKKQTAMEILSEQIDGWISPEDLSTLRKTEASAGSLAEFAAAIKECKQRDLHPFSGHVYFRAQWDSNAPKLQGNGTGREVLHLGVTIDGLRYIAERTGKYAGQRGPFWCGPDGEWEEIWLEDRHPAGCKVAVLREDFTEPLWAVVRWSDYVSTNRDGEPSFMWAKMGPHMLGKCAESLALRKAFPEKTGGLYTSEEMDQGSTTPTRTTGFEEEADAPEPADEPAPARPESTAEQLEAVNSALEEDEPAEEEPAEEEASPDPAEAARDRAQASRAPDRAISTGAEGESGNQLGFLFVKGVHKGPYSAEGLKAMIQREFGYKELGKIQRTDFDRILELAQDEGMAKRYNSGDPDTMDMFEGQEGESPDADGDAGAADEPEASAEEDGGVNPLQMRCGYCGAAQGEPCTTDSGDQTNPHKDRRERAAAKAGDVEALLKKAEEALDKGQEQGEENLRKTAQSIAIHANSLKEEAADRVYRLLGQYVEKPQEQWRFEAEAEDIFR